MEYNFVVIRRNERKIWNDFVYLRALCVRFSEPIDGTRLKDSKGVRRYIACQGPMKNTCVDMWQMVLDQNIVSIVMLCQTTENNKVKYK